MKIQAAGTFETESTFEPPFHSDAGMNLCRATVNKVFAGELVGASTVHMLAAMTHEKGSATYVAMEHISGSVAGKQGGFAVFQVGRRDLGAEALEIGIVAGSGWGGLTGIRGTMGITNTDGQHEYTLNAELPE